jgi:hypothetical protein
MKKTAALLLALLLAFSLFACGEKQTADAPSSPSGSAPSAEPSPDTGAQASAEPSPDTGAQASTVPEGSGTVGYITDDVDYFARDPYKLVYLYGIPVPISANVFTVLERLGEKMNYSIVSFCADGDMSKYIEYVETYIDMGIDGFLFSPQQDVMPRTDDLCSEAGVPYINMMTHLCG